VWRALGKTRWVLQARTLPATLSIIGAVLLVLLILGLWPAKFRLEAKGTLEPVLRQDVFANIDGVVQELKCNHGDKVNKDQLLVILRNTDLELAITEVVRELETSRERLKAVGRYLFEEKSLKFEQRNQLEGERAELEQKVKNLKDQLDLQRAKQRELLIKSPLNGLVVTWI